MPTVFCNRCGLSSADDAQFCQRCGAALLGTAVPVMPQAALTTHYAGFWIRVAASLMDTLLLLAAIFPIRLLLGSAVTVIGMNAEMPMHRMLLLRRLVRIAIGIAIALAYKAGMESSRYQGTLGKVVMRLKVTDLEGRRISLGRAIGRYFAKSLSMLSLFIGYLMVGFDEQKQGLHDRIAGTLVQYRQDSL